VKSGSLEGDRHSIVRVRVLYEYSLETAEACRTTVDPHTLTGTLETTIVMRQILSYTRYRWHTRRT